MSVDPIFDDKNKVKYSTIKWGKPGDWLKGTLVDNTRQVPNTLSAKKEMQTIFEFKIHGGEFHGINKDKTIEADPTILQPNSFWSVFAKPVLRDMLKNAKLGQVIGLRFIEEKPPKQAGLNPTKIIAVYLGAMDPEYHGEQSGDEIVNGEAFEDDEQ